MDEKGRKVPGWMVQKRKEAVSRCRILYAGRRFGWECGQGWNVPLAKLSYALEELNMRFRKQNVKIVAEQVKEKFGTLRFYFRTEITQPFWRRGPRMFFDAVCEFINGKFPFYSKTIIDRRARTVFEYRRLPDGKSGRDAGQNGRIYEDRNGNAYEVSVLYTPTLTHTEPTRHKLMYRFRGVCAKIGRWFTRVLETKTATPEQYVAMEYMDGAAEDLVRLAEKECMNRCEICGAEFDEYTKACTTDGWISIVCRDCLPDTCSYKMDGKRYLRSGGKDSEAEDREDEE